MESIKYIQVKKMLLESGINFLETSKEETIDFCKKNKDNLPERIYSMILDVINELHEEQKTKEDL